MNFLFSLETHVEMVCPRTTGQAQETITLLRLLTELEVSLLSFSVCLTMYENLDEFQFNSTSEK